MDFNQTNEEHNSNNNSNFNGSYNNGGANYGYSGGYSSYRRQNLFGIASLCLGILSVITCCFGITCIPFGALGILFALLSRGRNRQFSTMSLVGICTCAVGIAIGAFLVGFALKILMDPVFRAEYIDPVYRDFYGIDFEEFLQGQFHM